MILTHVKFSLAKPMTLDEANTKAVLRKTYLLSEDGLTAGAVYFWKDRASAERVYTDEWCKMVTEVYGVSPQISFYHAPVTVENVPT